MNGLALQATKGLLCSWNLFSNEKHQKCETYAEKQTTTKLSTEILILDSALKLLRLSHMLSLIVVFANVVTCSSVVVTSVHERSPRNETCDIPCEFRPMGSSYDNIADAIQYSQDFNFRRNYSVVLRKYPAQMMVLQTMESDHYYPWMKDVERIKHFNVSMTYRMDADIPMTYLHRGHIREMMRPASRPFANKSDHLVFIQSNCRSLSKREQVANQLRKAGFTIECKGACQPRKFRQPILPHNESKIDEYRKYKICLCMENSISDFYISEKLFDCYAGHCLPVYLGAPNIKLYTPQNSALWVADYPNVTDLATVIREVLHNETAYNSYFEWKKWPLSQQTAGFQELVNMANRRDSPQCMLCQLLATKGARSWRDLPAQPLVHTWEEAMIRER